jgi:CheY-specific phosphatase CheX
MPLDGVLFTAEELDDFLVSSTGEVLEKMFFTEIDTSGTDGTIETAQPIRVEVRFSGSWTGALRMLIDEEPARCLGTTLTCAELGEFPRECCTQVAGEMANMICGGLLSRIEPDANLALTTPEEVADVPAAEQTPAYSARRWFCFPEGSLWIELVLDPSRSDLK